MLSAWEGRWRPALEQAQRAFEVDASFEDLAEVARALGRVLSPHLGNGDIPRSLRWPACTVMVTVGAATDSYQEGAFWNDLWAFLDLPAAPRKKQEAWGEEFLRSLRVIGLTQDPERGAPQGRKRYVATVLLHAGVPTYCLDDLFDLLLAWRQQFPTTSVAHFPDWVEETKSRLASLDAPARTFLTESKQQAQPVLDRCVALLDRLATKPSDTKAWGKVGVAERFQRPALQALVRHQNRGHRAKARSTTPHLRYAPARRKVQLVLPSGWSAAPTTARWLRSITENNSSTTTVLTRFVRELRFLGPKGEGPTTMPVHGVGDRLLAFTRQGRAVPLARDVLPRALWLLHPQGSLVLSPEAHLLQREDLTGGWSHWQASCVDLPPGSRFRTEGSPWHHVALASAPPPEVLFPDPLPGATDSRNDPVHAQRPLLSSPSGEGAPWKVHVFTQDTDRVSPLGEQVLLKGETIDPLASLLWPQVGSFVLRAQRHGEKPHEWHFSLAEGVTVSHTPSLRLFQGSGLEPCHSRIRRPHQLKSTSGSFSHPSRPSEQPVRIRSSQKEVFFTVQAPHLEVSLSEGTHWFSEPLSLAPEQLRECGDLLFRRSDGQDLPDNAYLRLISPEEDILQLEQPRNHRGNTLAFPLGRFSEAARAHQEVTLELQLDDRTCPAVRVRPTPLATKAIFGEDDRIRLHGTQKGEQLVAGLYQEHAPWRDPVVLPVQDNQISTEEHFEIGGPVRVLLRVDDPWAASPKFPEWPGRTDGTVLRCDMPGRPNSTDREGEDLLCAYLSGQNVPASRADLLNEANTARAWTALARLGADISPKTRERFSALMERLARSPESIASDYASVTSPASAVWALILSGAASTLPRTHLAEEQLAALWDHNPVAAALLSRNALRMTSSVSSTEAALPEAVMRRCGPAAEPLLRGVPRPMSRPQTPGEHADVPPTNRELLEALHYSPGPRIGLLDPRVERLAVERATRVDTGRLEDIAERGSEVFSEVHAMCSGLGIRSHKVLTQLLAQRSTFCPEASHKVPALSLALAVNARIEARPTPPTDSSYLDMRHRTLWADLARALPELAALDIVLAELTFTGLERAQLH